MASRLRLGVLIGGVGSAELLARGTRDSRLVPSPRFPPVAVPRAASDSGTERVVVVRSLAYCFMTVGFTLHLRVCLAYQEYPDSTRLILISCAPRIGMED